MTLAQQTDRAVSWASGLMKSSGSFLLDTVYRHAWASIRKQSLEISAVKPRSDYTVIGHAVNLAARLESASTPGRILVGPETVVHLPERWIREPYKPLFLKGIDEPVAAFGSIEDLKINVLVDHDLQ